MQDVDEMSRHYNISYIFLFSQISPSANFDYEKQENLSITITTVDSGSPPLRFTQNVTVVVVDANEPPEATTLSNYQVII